MSVLIPIGSGAWAQTQPAAPRSQIAGTVTAVDVAGNQVSLKTDAGETVVVNTTAKTLMVHIAPGETDMHKGTRMALSDLGAGDRVVAIHRGPADQKTIEATSLVVRTKADLAQVAKTEQEDWQKRGVTGTVTALDPAARTVTLKAGQKTVTVEPSDKTAYHRYSPDSAKFSDAKPSSFGEIKIGDQVRALGNKSEDGSAVKAEKILFGTFRQIAATIISVDAATGELRVTDLATKKPLTIRVNTDSAMRKLEPQMAAMLARRYGAGRGRGPGDAAQGGPDGRGAARGGGASDAPPGAMNRPGAGAPGRGAGGGDIGQLLDRLPPMPLGELKPHDAVMISTTMGSDPTRVTVITLLAGVEPLLTASPNATRDIMSGWNLGGGGPGDGQ
ncbi:MAG: hypothetical protein LAP87_11225 [Acidobacteriia bacterium]|nr:hypothetical protein [Terriglobia bacterium]